MVSYADIAAAHERIKAHARRTPVLTSTTLDALTGARVLFKCENLQRMGAFKFRGAYNALSQLSDERKQRGVIAFSSGNHAQAVALAGRLLGIKALIVMPADAPRVKLEATRGYGAEVVIYEKGESREQVAAKLSREKGLTLIPPFDGKKRVRFKVSSFPYNPGKYWVTIGLSSRATGHLYHVQTQRYLFEVIDVPRVQERVDVPIRIEVEDL